MLPKNKRTLEVYKTAGAEMRLYKTLGAKLMTDISRVLSAADQDILMRAMNKIDVVCSRAEDNMFRDYPNLSSEHIDVFYGAVDYGTKHDLDAEMVQRAKQIADDLFHA